MDSGKSGGQGSSLDSLRTVEFRQTLRGYHIDDVDEYLERVAVDAEALQEQMRQAGERLKQAADRIAQLETMLQEAQQRPAPAAAPGEPALTDDTLQRTLVLAQKFVDQTQAEAETQARIVVADAEERARKVLAEAELQAKSVTEETERHLREEISRLESMRTQLAGDVETMARHMENERARLRGALADMLAWVDEHVPAPGSALGQRAGARPAPRVDEGGPITAVPDGPPAPGAPGADNGGLSVEASAGRSAAVPVQGNAATGGALAVGRDGVAPTAERPGALPVEGTQPQVISPR